MDAYSLIAEAIKNKKQVVAIYKDHYRELCPHSLGTKNGRVQGLFYQFGGHSSSGVIIPGAPSNWRCIVIDELKDIQIQDGEWHTAFNHSRPSTCIDEVHVEVDF